MRYIWVFCALGLIGCGTNNAVEDSGSDNGSGDGDDTDPADAALPDPTTGLDRDPGCEEVSGQAVPGATRFFIGDFTIDDDDQVTGQESWVLFANQAWVDAGEGDCQITWNASGKRREALDNCGSCAYALDLTLTLDTVASDCPAGLSEGEELLDVIYNVVIDGSASTFYFASGTALGEGAAGVRRVTYTSDSSCMYF